MEKADTFILGLQHVIKRYAYVEKYASFLPWIHDNPYCHAIKFEDLYPEVIDLNENKIGKTLRSLLTYLEVDVNIVDPKHLFQAIYNKDKTATDLKNKVGQYLRVFKDRHYKLLNTSDFKSMLTKMGYQW